MTDDEELARLAEATDVAEKGVRELGRIVKRIHAGRCVVCGIPLDPSWDSFSCDDCDFDRRDEKP